MKFGEKVKKLRKDMNLTQEQLGAKIGVSGRSVGSYEDGTSYPRYRKTYTALAQVFGVDEDYLRSENEIYMETVGQMYGTRGQRQANAILTEARRLFAGGDLSEDEKLAFLTEMQELFLDSKRRAQKYASRQSRDGNGAD